MRTTFRALFAVVATLALFPLVAACGKSGPARVNAMWTYDEERTVKLADVAGPKTKVALAGMVVDLQFRDDNSYSLSITGGPAPTTSAGTFKSGYDGVLLVASTVDGKPVSPPVERKLRAPERGTLQLSMGVYDVVLKRR